MSRYGFHSNPVGWSLHTPDGILCWESSLRGKARAIYHRVNPPMPGDQPCYCPMMPNGACWPGWMDLRGPYLTAWRSLDTGLIQQYMVRMLRFENWERDIESGSAA